MWETNKFSTCLGYRILGFLYWSCLISILPNSEKEKHEYKTFTQVFPNSLSCNHNFGIGACAEGNEESLLLNQSTAQSLCLTKSISNWKGVSKQPWFILILPLDPFFCWDASMVMNDTIVLVPRKCCLDIIGVPRTQWMKRVGHSWQAMDTHKIALSAALEIILAK